MSNTETKKQPTKLVLNNKADYDAEVERELTSLIFAECKKDTNNMSRIDALSNKLMPKAVKLVNERCRVKGTRTGHINHAPEEIQSKYNKAKEMLDGCNWVTDGVEYTCNLIAKKVVDSEKVEA